MKTLKDIRTLLCSSVLLTTLGATAQTLAPDFAGEYNVRDLGEADDVPPAYSSMVFKAGDSDTLLIGGNAGYPEAKIYEIKVARDAQHHITGFAGAGIYLADAPGMPPEQPLDVQGGIDGGLAYGPNGVLFYISGSDGGLSQIQPGATGPSKQIRLRDLGIEDGRAGLTFVPAGFAGAGRLKIAGWSYWCDTTVTPDGTGTFTIQAPTKSLDVVYYAGSPVFVKADGAGFAKDSVLLTSQLDDRAVVYEIDSNGDPVVSTLREFISDVWQIRGATQDPLTGDILLTTADGNNPRILLVGRLTAAQTQVQITFPQDGASFTAPAFFGIQAQASQDGGSISHVDFYIGDKLVGSPAIPPFSALADTLPAGSYTLSAVAYDGSGNATTSAPVHISVVNNGPQVTLVYPTNNTVLEACSDILVTATTQPGNSDITAVECLDGPTSLGVSHRAWDFNPYMWSEQDLAGGVRTFTVTVTDANGLTGVAVATNVTVLPLPLHKLVIHHYEADQLKFCFKGQPGSNYVWEATSSLLAPQWQPWLTNTASDVKLQVTVPFDQTSPPQFYRTRMAN